MAWLATGARLCRVRLAGPSFSLPVGPLKRGIGSLSFKLRRSSMAFSMIGFPAQKAAITNHNPPTRSRELCFCSNPSQRFRFKLSTMKYILPCLFASQAAAFTFVSPSRMPSALSAEKKEYTVMEGEGKINLKVRVQTPEHLRELGCSLTLASLYRRST